MDKWITDVAIEKIDIRDWCALTITNIFLRSIVATYSDGSKEILFRYDSRTLSEEVSKIDKPLLFGKTRGQALSCIADIVYSGPSRNLHVL